jgi:hypothetical protein
MPRILTSHTPHLCTTTTGDVHLTRICEMRQLENSLGFQSDFGLLSDDKALRYTSKAAALLGMLFVVTWCFTVPCVEVYFSVLPSHRAVLCCNVQYMSYGIAMPCFIPLGAW